MYLSEFVCWCVLCLLNSFWWIHWVYEESQDGIRDKDVIDVNDEEDTLVAKYIFNIKILSFSMQSVKTTFNLKLLYKLSIG